MRLIAILGHLLDTGHSVNSESKFYLTYFTVVSITEESDVTYWQQPKQLRSDC